MAGKAFVKAVAAVVLLALAGTARGQFEVGAREALANDRPEAWAMNHATAASLMTAFGAVPELAPGDWQLAAEAALLPALDDGDRRVGFNGNKLEDLDKSPVFGRLRWSVGLPGRWVGELAWTPPLEIDGARADHLFAAALGRRLLVREAWNLSLRAFGQHGGIEGDITCPARLAGLPFAANPYGCMAPSRDRVSLNHYGLDLVFGGDRGDWGWHADLGLVRNEPQVQVDALVFDSRDRSRLVSRDVLPYLALGGTRRLGAHWQLSAELLHVPMPRRRGPGDPHGHEHRKDHGDAGGDARPRDNEAYTGLRLRLVVRP